MKKNKPKKDPKSTQITVPDAKQLMPLDFSDLKLNPRELKFISVYCTNGFKGPEAALSAGYTGTLKSLKGTAVDLLKRPIVVAALKRFIDISTQQYKNKLEYELLNTYYKRAMYEISTFYEENGSIKPLDEIDPDWLCVIDGVEKRFYGSGANISVTSYQLPNRDNSLQMLWKIATGNDPNDSGKNMLPGETRAKLALIFNQVKSGAGETSQTPVKSTTRFTVEEIIQPLPKRGPGRPRKVDPPTIDITPKK